MQETTNKQIIKLLIKQIETKFQSDQETIEIFRDKLDAMEMRRESSIKQLDEIKKELEK